jgi:uncharacterized protein affecting Mg2+/Co2+ transport
MKTEVISGIRITIFAVCPRSGKFLGWVTEAAQMPELLYHIVEVDETNGVYFSRGYFLSWFETYVSELERNVYDTFGPDKAISMFPNEGPGTSRSVYKGIEVIASSIPALESNSASGVWIYRIKLRYIGGPGAPSSCQLLRRHWILTYRSGTVEHVRGDGVVGEQPILNATSDSFTYCSICTGRELATDNVEGGDDEMVHIHDPAVCMEGEFEFVVPSPAAPEQEITFQVPVKRFFFRQVQSLPRD